MHDPVIGADRIETGAVIGANMHDPVIGAVKIECDAVWAVIGANKFIEHDAVIDRDKCRRQWKKLLWCRWFSLTDMLGIKIHFIIQKSKVI